MIEEQIARTRKETQNLKEMKGKVEQMLKDLPALGATKPILSIGDVKAPERHSAHELDTWATLNNL
jgi:hypothetical protein